MGTLSCLRCAFMASQLSFGSTFLNSLRWVAWYIPMRIIVTNAQTIQPSTGRIIITGITASRISMGTNVIASHFICHWYFLPTCCKASFKAGSTATDKIAWSKFSRYLNNRAQNPRLGSLAVVSIVCNLSWTSKVNRCCWSFNWAKRSAYSTILSTLAL